jgi:hypothetical protein
MSPSLGLARFVFLGTVGFAACARGEWKKLDGVEVQVTGVKRTESLSDGSVTVRSPDADADFAVVAIEIRWPSPGGKLVIPRENVALVTDDGAHYGPASWTYSISGGGGITTLPTAFKVPRGTKAIRLCLDRTCFDLNEF